MEHFEPVQSLHLKEIEGLLQPLEASQTLERMGEESASSSLMYETDSSVRGKRALGPAIRFGRRAGRRQRRGVSTQGAEPLEQMAGRRSPRLSHGTQYGQQGRVIQIDAVGEQVKRSERRAGVDLDAWDVANAVLCHSRSEFILSTHRVVVGQGGPGDADVGEPPRHVRRRVIAVAGRRVAVQVYADRFSHRRRRPLGPAIGHFAANANPGHSTRMCPRVDNPGPRKYIIALLGLATRGGWRRTATALRNVSKGE